MKSLDEKEIIVDGYLVTELQLFRNGSIPLKSGDFTEVLYGGERVSVVYVKGKLESVGPVVKYSEDLLKVKET